MTPKEKQLLALQKRAKLRLQESRNSADISPKTGEKGKITGSFSPESGEKEIVVDLEPIILTMLLRKAYSIDPKYRSRSELWNTLKNIMKENGNWKNNRKE